MALAILAVLIFAWVIFGLVFGGEDQEPVADQEIVAQSQDDGTEPAAPEVENRNVDSYAAYEAKDPFRELVEPADAGTGTVTGGNTAVGDDTTAGGDDDIGGDDGGTGDGTADNGDASVNNGPGGSAAGNGDGTGRNRAAGGRTSGASPGSPGGGRQRGQGLDSDGDRVTDRRENLLGLDPTNPDTDGDGVPDGANDSNGDGVPDGDTGRRGSSGGGGRNGGSGGNDGLFDSGGSLIGGGK